MGEILCRVVAWQVALWGFVLGSLVWGGYLCLTLANWGGRRGKRQAREAGTVDADESSTDGAGDGP